MLNKIAEVAKDLGVNQSALALAWTLANTDTTICLMGASRLSQIEPNLDALKALQQWTPEIEARLEAILGNTPDAEMEWRTF